MCSSSSRRRRVRAWLLITVAVLGTMVSVLFHRYLFLGNFAAVEPGKVYRSAQPKGDMGWFGTYRLGSVFNLRGGSPADRWYAAEVDACRSRDVDFYDLPLMATRRPSRGELLIVLDVLRRCRYPLLIHCKSGSDRTGLVSALYRLSILGEPPERAQEAFSVWRGHVPIGGPESLQEPIREYAAWLETAGLAHSPARFRQWVEEVYASDGPAETPAIPLRPGPRPQITAANARRAR